MIIHFHPLLSLRVNHSYYGGLCRDFDFIVPPETTQLLNRGRIIAKELDNTLVLLFEAVDDELSGSVPMAPLMGGKIRLGLKLNNPYFLNFTDVEPDFLASLHVYQNDDSALDEPVKARLTGSMFTHTLAPVRPVTVRLEDSAGTVLETEHLLIHEQKTVTYDLREKPGGMYTVRELYGPGELSTRYYLDDMFLQQGANMVVEINIDENTYLSAPTYPIGFQAKSERLKYYVATRFYSPEDIDLLEVTDAEFSYEGRSQIVFEPLTGPFTGWEQTYARTHLPGDEVVLFRSTEEVPRQAKPRKGIQLSNDGNVLIANLPHPGADNTGSHIITRLVKPPV